MSSVYSALASLRSSVASATILSSSWIPLASPLSSAITSLIASPFSSTEMLRSSTFLASSLPLSSTKSICFSQYSFFWSSSSCSCFSSAAMLSIILMTLLMSTFLPCSARTMKSSSGRLPRLWRMFSMTLRAFLRCLDSSEATWRRLALGSVFLKSSRASSSLRILMVSWIATSSSLRTFLRSSHSADFESQLAPISWESFWSAMRAACDSVRSFFMFAMLTWSSPTRAVFFSMAAPRAWTCFVLAATSSS
mmetsp:Transcript_64511/g.166013  ORF Transcript_64511/g.166013 Transcript_64511/m.166013 type:complete len:251 (-) Transcript_64511:522-1274(-)